MRLAKSVRVVFGIAVSSGMALVLSGSALAADGGTGTTSENVVTNVVQKVDETGVSAKGVENAATPSVSNDTKKAVEAGPASADTTASKTTSDPAAPTAQPQVLSADSSAVTPASATTGAPGQPSVGNVVKSDPAAVRIDATEKSSSGVSTMEAKSAETLGAGSSTEVTPLERGVVFRSTVLPVQPKITNVRSVVVEDLATMIPSAPAQQQNPAKAPTPSQPSGVFGRIAAQLAGIVVPGVFWLPLLGLVRVTAQVLIIITLALLIFGRAGFTFGAWLRRGGYAHAARSDVAASGATFFATPFRLGYVSALQPPHSPFLVVADMKTVLSTVCNAFRKEEMR